ncbi:MAG: HD domain-containing protein [Syntrophomonas sp.]
MQNRFDLFTDFESHLLGDEKPSLYLSGLAGSELFKSSYPFTLLGDLVNIEQSPVHHPEGSVWEHTLLVVDLAAQVRPLSSEPRAFMWSALLHDLGKARTTKVRKGRITAYDHDRHGSRLAEEFLREFPVEEALVERVSRMVRWHMQILFVVKKLPFADIDRMLAEVPLGEIALLSLCDRLGRGGMDEEDIKNELGNLGYFLTKCQGGPKASLIEATAPPSLLP